MRPGAVQIAGVHDVEEAELLLAVVLEVELHAPGAPPGHPQRLHCARLRATEHLVGGVRQHLVAVAHERLQRAAEGWNALAE